MVSTVPGRNAGARAQRPVQVIRHRLPRDRFVNLLRGAVQLQGELEALQQAKAAVEAWDLTRLGRDRETMDLL